MKRGSALLIVLGMLAFMVISAVAFSAYMRYSRLPSSYLRRSSASRLLVKAALAEAIDEIDSAICNNPHPGVGKMTIQYDENTNVRSSGGSAANHRNTWLRHVYLGTNANDDKDAENKLVDSSETVSTLTLEGLAYIPPALVNDARYYSRRSRAAQWKNLDFESGRYAFCALDVSDCFDVNALSANFGRGSSPATRLSLAYLFENTVAQENEGHTSYSGDPSSWDDFIRKFWSKTAAEIDIDATDLDNLSSAEQRKNASGVPLVSVADLNLALQSAKFGGSSSGVGGFESPFVKWLESTSPGFYSSVNDKNRARNMLFVTDGFYPTDADTAADLASGDAADLTTREGQPFPRDVLGKTKPQSKLNEIKDYSSKAADLLKKRIGRLGLAMLYDYLDPDSVPISLSVPSVERMPMVAAVEQKFTSGQLAPGDVKDFGKIYVVETKSDSLPTEKMGQTVTIQYAKDYYLKNTLAKPDTVDVLLTYPFRHDHDEDTTYTVDGFVEYYFSLLDSNGNDSTKLFRIENENGFLQTLPQGTGMAFAKTTDSVFGMRLGDVTYTPKTTSPAAETDPQLATLQKITLKADMSGAGNINTELENRPFLRIVKQRTATWVDDGLGKGSYVDPGEKETDPIIEQKADGSALTSCLIPPLVFDGSKLAIDPNFDSPKNVFKFLSTGTAARRIKMHMAVWVRVRQDFGDRSTVDLVPACPTDDHEDWGQSDGVTSIGGPRDVFTGANGFPILRFDDDNEIEISAAGLKTAAGSGTLNLLPKSIMCPDPRWNFAPEHWFVKDNAVADSGQTWLDNCGVGKGNRDNDIFMATSDAGYMQSVYELAFLPRVTNLDDGNQTGNGLYEAPTSDGLWDSRDSLDKICNKDLMWRTYTPFNRRSNQVMRDPFEYVGLVNDGNAVTINPYCSQTNAVMAAFANTPVDWWAAATLSDSGVAASDRKDAKKFNKDYAFNSIGGNETAVFAWKDLYAVAQSFIGKIRARVPWKLDESVLHTWKEVWDGVVCNIGGLPVERPSKNDAVPPGQFMEWDEDTCEFCGLPSFSDSRTKLFDVDRKFLYGYWRDCFAPKQQLFLIFVRAEPMITGGSGIRHVPPQLGARAVALVWRDPTPSTKQDTYAPHQTRILFYRQFE